MMRTLGDSNKTDYQVFATRDRIFPRAWYEYISYQHNLHGDSVRYCNWFFMEYSPSATPNALAVEREVIFFCTKYEVTSAVCSLRCFKLLNGF